MAATIKPCKAMSSARGLCAWRAITRATSAISRTSRNRIM
jgi:hypothetical protein